MVEDLNDPLPRSNNDQSIQVQFDKYHETYSDIAIEHLNDLKEFLKKVFLRKSTQKMTQIPANSTYINVRSDDSWIWMIEDDFNNAFPSSKNDLSIQIQFDNNIETRSDIVIERVALKEFLEKVFPKKLRTVVEVRPNKWAEYMKKARMKNVVEVSVPTVVAPNGIPVGPVGPVGPEKAPIVEVRYNAKNPRPNKWTAYMKKVRMKNVAPIVEVSYNAKEILEKVKNLCTVVPIVEVSYNAKEILEKATADKPNGTEGPIVEVSNAKEILEKATADRPKKLRTVVAPNGPNVQVPACPKTALTPIVCTDCEKVFKKEIYLRKHEKTCKGFPLLQCPTCRRSFANKTGKSRHIKNAKCTEVL